MRSTRAAESSSRPAPGSQAESKPAPAKPPSIQNTSGSKRRAFRSMSPDDRTTRLLRVARGDAPADLVLSNGRIINVFSSQIETADIAIADGIIAGVGPGYEGKKSTDLNGAYVAPGLIDAHVH